jgi:UTP-glucose-1-phosphate uridylyltransferase
MTKVFGSTLRTLRKSKGVSQATLSAEFKVASGGSRLSKTTIHNLERGVNNTRLDRHKISALATALGLSNHETQQLFEAAGYSADSELLITRMTNAVQSLIDSVGNQAQPFVAQIEQLANRYKLSITQQSEGVSVLLIPIAGWQAKVLADELVERMLVPALEEATNAGIKEVVLIVAPGKGSKWKFEQQFRTVSITRVEQENASGLGGALATGRPENTFSPIAVLLPDEVDEKRRALSDMVQEFRKVKKPLIGVYPRATSREEITLLKQYGVVGLKTNTGPRSGRTWQLSQPLIEKPQTRDELPQENRKVAGRYIFTAEVFDTIQLLAPNLTTAINYNWDLFRAFELRDELTSLAPYKQILELKFVRLKP